MDLFTGNGGYLEWLCGEDVWAYTLKDENDMPTASPNLGHVLKYDLVIRNDVAKRMNAVRDYKSAL